MPLRERSYFIESEACPNYQLIQVFQVFLKILLVLADLVNLEFQGFLDYLDHQLDLVCHHFLVPLDFLGHHVVQMIQADLAVLGLLEGLVVLVDLWTLVYLGTQVVLVDLTVLENQAALLHLDHPLGLVCH